MARTFNDIINSLEQQAGLPESSARFTRPQLVDLMNRTIEQNVAPVLLQLNEEYMLTKVVVPLKTAGVANYPTGLISIPSRSYGQTLRAVSFQRVGETDAYQNIPYIEVRDEQNFKRMNSQVNNGIPTGYHFFNNGIKLLGSTDTMDGFVHLQFFLEASTLVDTVTMNPTVANIVWTEATKTTQVMVLTADIGTDLEAYQPNTTVRTIDVIHKAAGAVQIWDKLATRNDGFKIDGTPSGSYTAFTFSNDSEMSANKVKELTMMLGVQGTNLVLSPAAQAGFTTIPWEFDDLLVLDMARRVWSSLGDLDKAAFYAKMYEETHTKLTTAFGSRSKGEAKVIANRTGLMANLRSSRWGWRF